MVSVVVIGSDTDWITPIEDCVYSHIKQKWSISNPPIADLNSENKAWEGMNQHHVYVQRVVTMGKRELGTSLFKYQSTLRVHILMQRLSMGQIPIDMQNASTECQRIFWMYSPNWIAGIEEFDNIREEVIDEPDVESNPFKNTWHIALFVDAFYWKGTDFNIDIGAYDSNGKTAGQLTYL
jgi:hypothetical protein